MTNHPNKVLATTAFDVWSFGMILYILCAHEGASVFLTSAWAVRVLRQVCALSRP